MRTDQGPAQPGKQEGGRQPASDRAATPTRQEESTSLPPISNDNGATRRYQVQGGDSSCARRRRRSRGTPQTQTPTSPPPDWSPAVEGEILSDTGWITRDGRHVRVCVVRSGTSGGTQPQWFRSVTLGPEDDKDLTAVPARLPRKPLAPAGAVAAEIPLAAD